MSPAEVPTEDASQLSQSDSTSVLDNESGEYGKQRQIARLKEIAESLQKNNPAPSLTVRSFLRWFWLSQRRGHWIVSIIKTRLREAGLKTEPDFESAYLDAEITFKLAITDENCNTNSTPSTGQSAVETDDSSIAFDDPTYRISRLAAANKTPAAVSPSDTIDKAITIMILNSYSQLPVVTGSRSVKGMISWDSIGCRKAIGADVQTVKDAMIAANIINHDDSLFTSISTITQHGYALVKASDNAIVGIVTTSDLSQQFQQLTEPFLLLGEIENHIRRIINSKFTPVEIATVKDNRDVDRDINSAADLTFGEYKVLLENIANWERLHLSLDRTIFIEKMETIRRIRNDIMHFDPDGISEDDLLALRNFTKFLQILNSCDPLTD